MILHHLQNSRSQRILWLLEELELPYELKLYDTVQARQTNLKFPTLDIPHDTQTVRLTESSAIVEYLCQRHQKLIIPHDHTQYWNFCFYSHYSDASLMPNLALKQVFQHIKQQTPLLVRFVSLAFQSAFNRAYLNPELHRQLKEIDTHLNTHAYFAGDVFSYADILMWVSTLCSQLCHTAVCSVSGHSTLFYPNTKQTCLQCCNGTWAMVCFIF